MNTTGPELALAEAEREKRAVALSSVLACVVLLTMKTIIGLSSNSLGVLSEAAHSGLDLIATIITYLSVRVADKPADADHQYGHAKFENFGAILETALLLIACTWIVWEAVHRLMRPVEVEPSWLAFSVLLLTLGIDFFRSRALLRVARKHNSQALEADALHFSTDLWTTLVVLFGLAAVWASHRFGIPWLRHADPVAALVVAGAVLYIGLRLAKRSVDVLTDAAPAGVRARVQEAVAGVEGVLRVDRVRTRQAGNRSFVDVTIAVPRTLPFEQVHQISDQVETAVEKVLPHADVIVHMEPREDATESLFDKVRAIAQRNNLLVHELSAHQLRSPGEADRLVLELDAEVDERLTLREAHALIDRVERQIQRELPQVSEINTHIETLGREAVPAAELDEVARALESFLREAPYHFPELLDCHEVHVRQADGKIVASCHATLKGDLPITRVHDITQELETRTYRRFPQVFRLTIHTEPAE
ncbi:MAG TPA: cation diffusion facilitator family transporter [Candidatus Xenobia bacterium]|nr:cation diffusion facilitator family transporter [Candidatus Xenobia bacterium]